MKGKILEHYEAEFFGLRPHTPGSQLIKVTAERARRGMPQEDRQVFLTHDNIHLRLSSIQARLLAECLVEAADYLEPR